jgi:hypothetical protein
LSPAQVQIGEGVRRLLLSWGQIFCQRSLFTLCFRGGAGRRTETGLNPVSPVGILGVMGRRCIWICHEDRIGRIDGFNLGEDRSDVQNVE